MKNDQEYLAIIIRKDGRLVVDKSSEYLFKGKAFFYELSIREITPLPKDEKEES